MRTAVYILLLSTCAFAETTAAPSTGASASTPTASRMVLRVGEQRPIDQVDAQAVIVVNERVAQAADAGGRFVITAREPGETLAQVVRADGMHVVVLVVERPPREVRRPPEDALQTLIPIHRDVGVTSFFGANSATTAVNVGSYGTYMTESVRLAGRVQGGRYDADLEATVTPYGAHLTQSRLSWFNDQRTRGFDVGHTAATLAGSQTVPAMGVLGLRVQNGRPDARSELVLGTLRRFYTSQQELEPVVAATWSGNRKFSLMPGWALEYRGSAAGFATEEMLGMPGRVGMQTGAEGRFLHKSGFGFELRTSGQVAHPREDDLPVRASGELGAALFHASRGESYRLEYEGNLADLYSPVSGGELPARSRVGASMSRQFAESIVGSASWSRQWLWDDAGRNYTANSFNLAVGAALTEDTDVSASGGSVASLLPLFRPGGETEILEYTRWYAQLAARHRLAQRIHLQSSLRQDWRITAAGRNATSTLNVGGLYAPERRWSASGNAHVSAMQNGTVAADQPPLSFDAGLSANGQLLVARGLQAQAGVNVLHRFSSPLPTQVGTTVGVQFTPTTSHVVVASATVRSPFVGGTWDSSAQLQYTYHFGNDVHERPIFEFLARGEIYGVVCIDLDADGQCGPGETAVPDVQVRLSDGQVTRTDMKGRYAFDALQPGFYSVQVDETALRELGRLTTSSVSSMDLPAAGQLQATFGVTRTCRIQGHVFEDLDMDGRRSADDALSPGVRILARRGGVEVAAQAGATGSFRIDVPECGVWEVEVDAGSLPASTVVISKSMSIAADPGHPATLELMVGSLRTVQGVVYVDANRNGQRDPGEKSVPGARLRVAGRELTSSSEGTFLIRRLPAGKLELEVIAESLADGLRPGAPVPVQLGRRPVIIDNIGVPVLLP